MPGTQAPILTSAVNLYESPDYELDDEESVTPGDMLEYVPTAGAMTISARGKYLVRQSRGGANSLYWVGCTRELMAEHDTLDERGFPYIKRNITTIKQGFVNLRAAPSDEAFDGLDSEEDFKTATNGRITAFIHGTDDIRMLAGRTIDPILPDQWGRCRLGMR